MGERCDTHGTRSDLMLTLEGHTCTESLTSFRVNQNVYPRFVGVPKLAHGLLKLNPSRIPTDAVLGHGLRGPCRPRSMLVSDCFFSSNSRFSQSEKRVHCNVDDCAVTFSRHQASQNFRTANQHSRTKIDRASRSAGARDRATRRAWHSLY